MKRLILAVIILQISIAIPAFSQNSTSKIPASLSSESIEELFEIALNGTLAERDSARLKLKTASDEILSADTEQIISSISLAGWDPHANAAKTAELLLPMIPGPHTDLVKKLIELLTGKDWTIQRTAGAMLIRIGTDAVPELLNQMNGSKPNRRTWAIKILTEIGPDVIDYLVPALEDKDIKGYVAAVSLGIISRRSPDAAEWTDLLSDALSSEKDYIRLNASLVLILGGNITDGGPVFLETFGQADWDMKVRILMALSEIRSEPINFGVLFRQESYKMLNSRDDRAEIAARGTTPKPGTGEMVDLLLELLDSRVSRDDKGIRGVIFDAIGDCGPVAAYAVPDLVALMDGGGEIGSTIAIGAFRSIGFACLPELMPILKSESKYKRNWAARGIASLGPLRASEFLPDLILALTDRSEKVRGAICLALGNYGSSAQEAIPALIIVANDDKEEGNRIQAIVSLLLIAPEDPEVQSTIIEALETDDEGRKVDLLWVLNGYEDGAAIVETQLDELLQTNSEEVFASAARAFHLLGPAGIKYMPTLLERIITTGNIRIYRASVKVLRGFGIAAKDAAPAVMNAFIDSSTKSYERRLVTYMTLYDLIDEPDAETLAFFNEGFEDKEYLVKLTSANFLALANGDSESLLPVLTDTEKLESDAAELAEIVHFDKLFQKGYFFFDLSLYKKDDSRRRAAYYRETITYFTMARIKALAKLAVESEDAKTELLLILSEGDAKYRAGITAAINDLVDKNIIDADDLLELLDLEEEALRIPAIQMIEKIGKKAYPALDALMDDPYAWEDAAIFTKKNYKDLKKKAESLLQDG